MNRNDLPKPNTTCEICGHQYRICSKCAQMRSRGLETWRQHCDSYECAMYYYLLKKDYSEITKEEFDNVINTQLPDDREPTKDIQIRLDRIEHYFSDKDKEEKKQENKEIVDMKW